MLFIRKSVIRTPKNGIFLFSRQIFLHLGPKQNAAGNGFSIKIRRYSAHNHGRHLFYYVALTRRMEYSLEQIKSPVKHHLEGFEEIFSASMKTHVPLLNTIMKYIVRRKGKQMRPLFVMYSAALFGEINQRTYRGASMVELLHTATLVHDDVVDESYLRRGFFSINALWKNKIAVLVGDYLLSRGLLLSVENRDFDLLEIVSDAVRKMSEGELLQLEKARRLDITEDVYFDIISKKTASLIASCCAIGSMTTQKDTAVAAKMKEFGMYTGIAFQIKDDLFDYGDNKSGKPTGIDIKEKKMTLPLIHSLQQTTDKQRRHIINLIRNHSKNPEKVNEVMRFVLDGPGMEYSRAKMTEYRDKAFAILDELPIVNRELPMKGLVNYVIDRVK